MNTLFEGYEPPKRVKAPAYYFQSRALEFITEFKVQPQFKSSIFSWFRKRGDKAETAFRAMHGKQYKDPATYFLKLVNL